MIKLSGIRLSEQCDVAGLQQIAAEILGVPAWEITAFEVNKLSIDARRKSEVRFVYSLILSLKNEAAVLLKANKKQQRPPVSISSYTPPDRYTFPALKGLAPPNPPIIVGMGPAGLFAALCLLEAGVKCIILERGQPIEQRIGSVHRFWQEGVLNEESNVQFGEGGAGTFSDGKLTTGISDTRIRHVLSRLVEFGAPKDILYLAKPHIGTDKLRSVVIGIRKKLITLGCDVRFGHRLADIEIMDGALRSVSVIEGERTYNIATSSLILAPGNSSRDTFEVLDKRGIKLSPKPFSVGVRIEHKQSDIDFAQYGNKAMTSGVCFPSSDYKIATHLDGDRSVYSFCVCPGGLVVAAASERDGLVTNGMSLYARSEENINGALLVSVTPEDFGIMPLDGVAFQRKIEQAAFVAGGSNYYAPAQLVGDFLEKRASIGPGKIMPSYLPGVKYCNLWDVLPEFVCVSLRTALLEFSKSISGFSVHDAVMTAAETRSSSPLRILREDFQTVGIKGIFPCGEGAGYAGGIMSAAVDGIKCAEAFAASASVFE